MQDIKKRFESKGYKLVSKYDSDLQYVISVILGVFGSTRFINRVWTSYGKTIYYPYKVHNPWDPQHRVALLHEEKHLDNQEKWSWLFYFSYIIGGPLPIGLAYFRAMWEARAYAINIVEKDMTVDRCSRLICSFLYFWPLPRDQVKQLLEKEVEKLQNNEQK